MNSHLEAVLNNRLSKANKEKVFREQRRLLLNSAAATGSTDGGGKVERRIDLCKVRSHLNSSSSSVELVQTSRAAAAGSRLGSHYDLSDELVSSTTAAGSLLHAKSTGNLLSGGIRRLKQALR